MHIAFFSTMSSMPWGGSEELWSQAALELLAQGHRISAYYRRRKTTVQQIERLREKGANIYLGKKIVIGRGLRKSLARFGVAQSPYKAWLQGTEPDLLVVSMGWHLDDLVITQTCRRLGIPYALLVQAASPYVSVGNRYYEDQRAAFAGAAKCYFVSEQNREIVHANLALDLAGSAIVDNAFNVASDATPSWPADDGVYRLACVGRISFQSKGQDLILQVLRQPKWKERQLQVVLWGADEGNLRQIKELVALHGMEKQVVLGGFSNDIRQLWSQHHGLILPSRYEGNPLAAIEAMMCGRMPIITDIGRASELIDDNRSGFIAAAATAPLLDDALERAWARRDEWQAIGALAARTIRERHSMEPAKDFARAVLEAATAAKPA